MIRSGLAAVAAALLGTVVFAQLKVDVALINVVATVTDDKGRYVEGLTKDDFIVEEDGRPQSITHFTQSHDLPVSVGVTLDTSGSMERKINTATRAVERFIRTIHGDDDVFLMTFSDRPILRQDFTADREKLATALRRVNVSGGTALYDALEQSLVKIKSGAHDKRAILLITDGEDTSSMLDFEGALLAVRESELLVYCVGISPASYPLSERIPPSPPTGGGGRTGPGRQPRGGGGVGLPIPGVPGVPLPFPVPGRRPYSLDLLQRQPQTQRTVNRDSVDMDVLNRFAIASGGRSWLLSGSWTEGRGNQVEDILDQIASELRNQYSIGYYPNHPLDDGKWHRIEIKAKNPRYHVRARKEYFGK